jgi:hypothetical protein
MAVSAAIVEALRRLDTTRPPQAGQYIDRTVPGVGRGWDLPKRLEVLVAAGSQFRALLHGAVGVGKTTELYRWSAALQALPKLRAPVVTMPPFAEFRSPEGVRQFSSWIADQHRKYLQPREKLVLLVDGLDLLSPAQTDDAFGSGSPLFSPDVPPVVYAAPHSVILQAPAKRAPQIDQVWHLPPFPVLDARHRPDPRVVEHVVKGLEARIGDLAVLEDARWLRRIAIASGGVPRSAIRILRGALLAAADAGKVNAAHVLEGERELRQDLEAALEQHDVDQLHFAFESGVYRGDPRLVVSGTILPYEGVNPDRYWVPHPLLWSLFRPREEVVALLNA